MVNIISDYIPPFSPLPNIAPFTYKDGETYLSTLDRLRTFVNTDLVAFINTNFTELSESFITEVNTLITAVNSQLAENTNDVDAKIATLTSTINSKVTSITAGVNVFVNTNTPDDVSHPQISVPGVTLPTASTLVARDASGRSQVAAPETSSDIATKGYVDSQLGPDAGVNTIVAGDHISIDATDNVNPIISVTDVVSSIATASNIYATDGSGAEIGLPYTNLSTPNTIIFRDNNGRVKVADPLDVTDAATKKYVDTATGSLATSKLDKVGTANVAYITDGSGNQSTRAISTAATANTIPVRDTNGRMKSASPSATDDIAIKSYVDAQDLIKGPQPKYDTYSARPAANTVPVGTMYYCSDIPEQYYSNGTTWLVIGSGGNELGSASVLGSIGISVTQADLAGLTVTFKAGVRPIYADFSADFSSPNNTALVAYFNLDGTNISQIGFNNPFSGSNHSVAMMGKIRIATLTPGTTHTIKMRAGTDGAAGSIGNNFQPSLLTVVNC